MRYAMLAATLLAAAAVGCADSSNPTPTSNDNTVGNHAINSGSGSGTNGVSGTGSSASPGMGTGMGNGR